MPSMHIPASIRFGLARAADQAPSCRYVAIAKSGFPGLNSNSSPPTTQTLIGNGISA
jgi:hypothetical protein